MTLAALAIGGALLLASGGFRAQIEAPRRRAALSGASRVPCTATKRDYDPAEWSEEPPQRIGHGFDIHRMTPKGDPEGGGPVVVGGVVFEDFELRIVAHSDGDVAYHSIVDAIFGALTLPDIGAFFPDTDPRWKGAPSDVFMDEAWKQMDARGYRIGNLDVTLIAEAPRMIVNDHPKSEPGKPFDHKLGMVENIASLLGCPPNRVNVKARTHEKVDAVGEKRAKVAMWSRSSSASRE
eukprot:CAMPEP_0177467638 /NCGR_PEP_ID=MMETSP0369-20130122/18626_1 /TAXON_ID=447022 ORGANISM="Scrippsiella hangoei-like, Strain SHHI-4" /NCGR_SAMPLE_ID=MMETSP0369 /ASSEMBLY_ACC=CAM_ASM_000364 /LENGTH=236 /DNA_ID=CAMNT_0018941747 /DNA_START=46 /DNA_END=754 /DNA_ORIENTATION=-